MSRKGRDRPASDFIAVEGFKVCRACRERLPVDRFGSGLRAVDGICKLAVEPGQKWHIDHRVPLVKGGEHSYANTQLAHARCNLSKGAKA